MVNVILLNLPWKRSSRVSIALCEQAMNNVKQQLAESLCERITVNYI